MTAAELNDILALSASEVLEGMFFTSPIGDLQQDELPAGEIAVSLSFRGQPPGSFGLRTSPETGSKLAVSFLGSEEESIDAEKSEEVLCELANMLCGSVLSRMAKDSLFVLTQPKVDPPDSPPTAKTAQRTLEIEEGSITLWIATETT